MPTLITKIEAKLLDSYTGELYFFSSLGGEIQFEDYVELYDFIAYLQTFSKINYVESLQKPVQFGLKNQYNISTTTLEISY